MRSELGLVIAGLLVIAALIFGRRAVTNQIVDHNWHALERLRTLTGIEFERHVAELYRRLGYNVELTRGSGDQGIDVIAQSAHERVGIQCKQWTDVVGNSGVQEAIAGRAFYNCSRAAVVCTSSFTQPARELALRANIELIDGVAYAALVNRFHPLKQPSGMAAWIPRGRPAILQLTLLALAFIIFVLHFDLQRPFAVSTANLAAQRYQPAVPAPYKRAGMPAPYQPSNASVAPQFASTVGRFYAELNSRNYAAAYALLSPSFQRSSPYSIWLAGYSDTLSTFPRITASSDPTIVAVVVTANERTADGTGTQVTVYSGALTGVQTPNGSWLIDGGHFRMVNRVRQ